MKFEEVEAQKANKEMLPKIVSRIFSICKTDTNFPLREEIGKVDQKMAFLKSKIKRQNDLFKQSQHLTHQLDERINLLEERNMSLKEKLLDSLGSEL